jgi:D-alanyl-D-alanine carboxypeptidase
MATRTTRTTWRRAGATALAAALVLSGCGGDDDDETTSGSEVPATTAAAGDLGLTVVEDGLDPDTDDALADAAEAAFAQISAPGAVMAVRTDEGTWIATIGSTELDGTEPMSADLHQRIGSITKTFTVTALLQLVGDGELTLDDPIGDYVEGTPNPEATLGQLAAMRSGIPSFTFDEDFVDQLFADPREPWEPEELVAVVDGAEPDFAPGEATSYSNTNTVLLGMVIEQVTGQPIAEVLDERIIEPLGLTGTSFPDGAELPDPHARGYTVQGQDDGEPTDATDWNPSWSWTAGAMISTLDDLLVYGEELVAGDTLLSPELQARRIDSFDFSIEPNTPERAYGLGLGFANGWYGHTGELPGFNTVLQHHLDDGITVIVLANSDIKAGDCPADAPALPDGPKDGPCEDPAVHLANALTAALGVPLVAPTEAGSPDDAGEGTGTTTDDTSG